MSLRPHCLESPCQGNFVCYVEKVTDLYKNNSDQKKLELKDKLRKIKLEKGEMIPKYLIKLT